MTYEPADIIIYIQGRGIVGREKSLVAFRRNDGKVLAYGTEAERMAERERDMENIVVVSPLRQGMVVDYLAARELFCHLVVEALGKKPFRKPAVAICVPKGITTIEKKAIEDIMFPVAREVFIADIPAEEFIREFPQKFKVIVGITKEEPERYIEERLRDIVAYAGQEQISQERVYGLMQKIYCGGSEF